VTARDGNRDLEGLEREVRRRLEHELPEHLHYHDAAHTLEEVVPTALALAAASGVAGLERDRLHAAALLHDLGFTRSHVEHERVGAELARDILPRFGFDDEDVAVIARLIEATCVREQPRTLSEAIIKDADLDVLGRDDFWQRNDALRRERAALGAHVDEATWLREQARFIREHSYHCQAARSRRDEGKRRNEREILRRQRALLDGDGADETDGADGGPDA
jgi:predicted metal-dependent HD superfamily phosphohydrolase